MSLHQFLADTGAYLEMLITIENIITLERINRPELEFAWKRTDNG